MAKDLYSVLGVQKGASQDEIRKVYRGLARKLHPDVRPGDAAAEKRFKEITQANNVLGDVKKRKLYDEFGEAGLRDGFDAKQARAYSQFSGGGRGGHPGGFGGPMGGGGGGDMSDIFSQLFGGGGGQGRPGQGSPFGGGRPSQGRGKGADVEASMDLDFLDALRGSERTLTVRVPNAYGGEEKKQLRVRIPPGAADGSRIRLKGKGRPGQGGPGDLLISLKVRTHPTLSRKGKNIEMSVPITVTEAVLGAKIEVPTLGGKVTVRVPEGSHTGQKMRLKGKGVPSKKGTAGDLYLVLKVILPKTQSDDLKALAEKMASHYEDDDVRGELSF